MATAMDWLRYANQGAVRNQPISPQLAEAMSFLPEMGLEMSVFSGGQPQKGSGQPRVGSVRHDGGGAADVFFYRDGQRLDWSNPDDLPVYQDIVRRARERGVTGIGAGEGYMQPGSMHIGFGQPAVWGAGGRGANAPDWLREAYYGAVPGAPPNTPVGSFATQPGQGRMTPQTAQQGPQGLLPLSMGEQVPTEGAGLLASLMDAYKDTIGAPGQQQMQAPQMQQRQAQPYQPQRRDPAAPLLAFFQSMRGRG